MAAMTQRRTAKLEWERLSNLEMGPQLGRGAFCEVHLASFPHTHEQVALKRVRSDLRPGSQRDLAIRDLKTEIDVLLRIEPHEHIVRIIGRGTDGDSVFAVLEVVPETFSQRLDAWKSMQSHVFLPESFLALSCCMGCAARRRSLWRAQLQAGRDLASALAHLHGPAARQEGQKLIYRDLKPSNIGFDGDRLVLFDFGLAKLIPINIHASDRYKMTPETGSTRFMAPEVARGEPYDEMADVYSFGILLWQILALETPFHGHNPSTHRRLVVDGVLRPPIDLRLSDNIRQLLKITWASAPHERPSADTARIRLDAEIRTLSNDRLELLSS